MSDLTNASNNDLMRAVYDRLRKHDAERRDDARLFFQRIDAMEARYEAEKREASRKQLSREVALEAETMNALHDVRQQLIKRGLLAPDATLDDLRRLVMPEQE